MQTHLQSLDKLRNHLKKIAPEHVKGYDEGWLHINWYAWGCHIYSKEKNTKKLVTTYLVPFNWKEVRR